MKDNDQLISIVASYRQRRLPWRAISKLLEEEHGIVKDYRNLHQWWQRKLKAARRLSRELEPLGMLSQQPQRTKPILNRKPKPAEQTQPTETKPKPVFELGEDVTKSLWQRTN